MVRSVANILCRAEWLQYPERWRLVQTPPNPTGLAAVFSGTGCVTRNQNTKPFCHFFKPNVKKAIMGNPKAWRHGIAGPSGRLCAALYGWGPGFRKREQEVVRDGWRGHKRAQLLWTWATQGPRCPGLNPGQPRTQASPKPRVPAKDVFLLLPQFLTPTKFICSFSPQGP